MPFLAPTAQFLRDEKTPPPWFRVFPCIFNTFGLHPDVAVANFRRSIDLTRDSAIFGKYPLIFSSCVKILGSLARISRRNGKNCR